MSTLSDVSQSGIGWVYPPQPQTVINSIDQVIGILSGRTPLTIGQDYVDVAFGTEQPNSEWVLLGCAIVNLVDDTVINVWPGVLTEKLTTGFRLQLNGTSDSVNYYLRWSIQGAFGYFLSGPSGGINGVASTEFTVALAPDTTLTSTAVITPHSSGGGSFSPSTASLTALAPSATFRFTPSSIGAKTISVTNNRGLTNPSALTYTVTALATSYTLSGPSSGDSGVESTDFTVEIPAMSTLPSPVTITPDDGGDGGTFTPVTVDLSTGSPSATFTYTPASSGSKTISTTNDGTLSDPAPLSYLANLADGNPVSTWMDDSGNGHDGEQTGSARPVFKVNILNGKPVVRFSAAASSGLNLSSNIPGNTDYTCFVVMKANNAGVNLSSLSGTGAGGGPICISEVQDGNTYISDNLGSSSYTGGTLSGAFHVITGQMDSGTASLWSDGSVLGSLTVGAGTAGNFHEIGSRSGASIYGDGDIAELIFYNVIVGSTDRANIEKYLGTKWGITVAGGTAVQPDTVTGLIGWWKADGVVL